MGKQINFIMDEYDEMNFTNYILNSGTIIFEGGNMQPVSINALPEKFSGKGWFKVYLYKDSFKSLKLIELTNGRKYVDCTESSVIEFSRTIVRTDSKEISRGRIWLEMKYYDKNGDLIMKEEVLNDWYKDLAKWIKKNLKHREIQAPNKMYKEYISSSLINLVEQGYKLLG